MRKRIIFVPIFLIVLQVLPTLPATFASPEPYFEISAIPDSLSIQVGHAGATTVYVDSINGFDDNVYLFVDNVSPDGAPPLPFEYSFSRNPVSPPPDGHVTSTLTISVGADAVPGGYWIDGWYFEGYFLAVFGQSQFRMDSFDILLIVAPLETVNLTIASSPIDGVSINVDSSAYTTPYNEEFDTGRTLSITAPSTVERRQDGETVTYYFDRWIDNYGFSSFLDSISYAVPFKPTVVLTAEYVYGTRPEVGYWTTTEVVSSESASQSSASALDIDSNGNIHIAWHDYSDYAGSGGDVDIFYKRYEPGYGWTVTEVVSTESTGNSYMPCLFVDPTGNIHIAWYDYSDYAGSGGDADIFYKRYEPGYGWTTTEVVSTESTRDATHPCLFVDLIGNIHIAWEAWESYGGSGADIDIFYKRYEPGYGWTVTEVVSTESTFHSWMPSLAVDFYGNIHIAWWDATDYAGSGSDRDTFYKRYEPGSGWTTTQVVSTESTGNTVGGPELGLDTDGNIHIAWADETNYAGSGGDLDIFYKRYVSGVGWTSTEVVSTESTSDSSNPDLTVDSIGNLHVAWTDATNYEGSGSDRDTFYKRYEAGYGWTTTEVVSTESTATSWWPSLAVDSDGNMYVSWQDSTDYAGCGSDSDIFYKRFVVNKIVPITDPSIEKIQIRLSIEPVNGEWIPGEYKVIVTEIVALPLKVADWFTPEPLDPLIFTLYLTVADKDEDGKLSIEEFLEALRDYLERKLRFELYKLAAKHVLEIPPPVADSLVEIDLRRLATAAGAAAEKFGMGVLIGIGAIGSVHMALSGTVTTTNAFGIMGIEYPPWAVVGAELGPGQHMYAAYSPVDLMVTDEFGRVVNKTVSQIPGSVYVEMDLDRDGELDDLLTLPDSTLEYTLKTVPEPGSDPQENTTLMVFNEWIGLTIAQDVEVQNITEQEYVLRTYDKEFLDTLLNYTLTVSVIDNTTNTPISGAVVIAAGPESASNSTDGGMVQFQLQMGNYTITASKTGYYRNSTTINLIENTNITLRLHGYVFVHGYSTIMIGYVMGGSEAGSDVVEEVGLGTIKTVALGIYWDPQCSDHVSYIDWGPMPLGSTSNVTLYLRNEGNVEISLSLDTSNWNPPGIADFITLSWDYNGEVLYPNDITEVTFTLNIYPGRSSFLEYLRVHLIDAFSFDMILTLNERPVAVLSVDKSTVMVEESVIFDASGSIDDGRIDYYFYDFGDGTNSSWTTLAVVTHKYAEEGAYNATLIVMDDFGVASADGESMYAEITVRTPTWEYVFEDERRDTMLKISSNDKYFQFITPDKAFSIKHDPKMTVRDRFIVINFEDSEITLRTRAIMIRRWSFCIAIATDVETGTRYVLIDFQTGVEVFRPS